MPANRLLEHYVDNARALPWRARPGEPLPDPYRVWLSEIMLQQTTVATVIARFERFVRRWPTVQSLAAASEAEVLQEWAGLGYYARARNLLSCARAVAERGAFPDSEAELRILPGIGDYTAAAIAAIAFGRDAVPVDTNVERVVARLHAIERPAKPQLRRLAEAMAPPGRAGDFTQALMDLGAAICRPHEPRCGQCPLASDCRAFATGAPASFPLARTRSVRPQRFGLALWIERDGAIWLLRRPRRGLLGGMPALPGGDWTAEVAPEAPQALATIRHVFTHFALDLSIVEAADPIGEGWWQPLDRIAEAGLPTLYRKAVHAMSDCRRLAT